MKKYSDLLCGMIGIIVAIVMIILSIQIYNKEGNAIGASFLPLIVAGMVLVLSMVLSWRGWQDSKNHIEQEAEYPLNTKGVWIMIGACFLYVTLLKPVGFIISSAGFLFLSLCLMTPKEKTNYLKFVVITAIAIMAIYLIFTEFFGIRLPHGIL